MRRRTFIAATASVTVGLGGCVQEPGDGTDATSPDGTGPGSQPEGTDGETDTPDGETPGEGTDADGSVARAWASGGHTNGVTYSFTSWGPEIGENRDVADIRFESGAGEVLVDGTISGSDSCERARLGSVRYDEAAGTLTVAVETTTIEGCEAGAQALVGIDYEATFEVDGEFPSEVTVTHDGRAVASATYASASATAVPPSDE
ncbi:MAG: hypothetical protein ABEJ94_04840 [Halorientalis sp.]